MKDIMEFAGAWEETSNEEVDVMKKNIRKLRKRSTQKLLKDKVS